MLSAAPLFIGAVYIEEDYGSDYHGDTIEISFQGGAPDTELKQLVIDGDQIENGNPTGFSLGDVFFDTADGGLGADAWFEQDDVHNVGIDFVDIDNAVVDGSSRMVLNFSGFHAGDKLIIEVDVDEVLDFNPAETDLKKINDGFDPITSGREFRNSQLHALLTAPHYEDAQGSTLFVNEYDPLFVGKNLDLTPDDGALVIQHEEESIRDRTAGALLPLQQTPLPITIAGSVYEEINLDLVQDQGEDGIGGVTLSLYKEDANGDFIFTQHTTVTDGNGDYLFGRNLELMPGVYQVREGDVPGYFDVGAIPGTVDGTPTGSTVFGNLNRLTEIDIPYGNTHAIDYDFAEAKPAEISGFVYHDSDMDGLRTGEQGIRDVEIQVIPVDTIAPQQTVSVETDNTGFYKATGLAPGHYRVIEPTQPAPFWDWLDAAGTVQNNPSGAALNPGDEINGIFLGGGQSGIEYNFGEHLPVSIRGNVHLAGPEGDCYSSCSACVPLSGVTVMLQDAKGKTLKTATTDESGNYAFINLMPGEYRVVEITPPELIDGDDFPGTVKGQTVGQVVENDTIAHIVMASGQSGINYDFCEHEPATISGYVYHDRDNDGRRDDPDEEGIGQVEVVLSDAGGNPLKTAFTNDQGYYQFTRLAAGDYVVTENHPPAWTDGIDTPGTVDDVTRGVADDPGDRLYAIHLQEGDDGVEYNFGELLLGSIAGVVRMANREGDCYHEGVTGCEPIEGVIVKLQDAEGNELNEVTTGPDGRYRFNGLMPGTYTVVEITPAGLIDGEDHVGLIDGVTVGAILQNDVIGNIGISSGQSGEDYDFCEHDPATISGFVYHDRNNDGEKTGGEEGIGVVTLSLLDRTGNTVRTTQTNALGYYEFTNLAAGTYHVVESHPDGWIDGLDTAGTIFGFTVGAADPHPGDAIRQITIGEGETGVEYNFGEFKPASIAGLVHVDPNRNCYFDDGEDPIAGVTIELLDATGAVVATTTTDPQGRYRFDVMSPGIYTVRETQPKGYFQGGQRVGSGDGDASVDDLISTVTIASEDHLINYDFCEVPPAQLSGYVFQDGPAILVTEPDQDISGLRDGVLTPDDTRLPGVVLELRQGVTGVPIDADTALPGVYPDGPIRTVTDANGFYEFTGLRWGNYAVYEVHPDGYIDSIDTPGTRSGIAFNPGESVNPAISGLLVYNPNDDAIIRIVLFAGDSSEMNNFSELATFPPPPPPPEIILPPIERFMPELPNIIEPSIPFIPFLPPTVDYDFGYGAGGMSGYTWHLSVVNAGKPRGEGQVLEDEGPVWLTGSQLASVNWTDRLIQEGSWQLEGDQAGVYTNHLFGLTGATAVSGDFDGDGVSEIGIFYKGEWFIDLNGNGRWDSEDIWAKLGHDEDLPVTGDWDGDGKDDIGIFGPAWAGDPRAILLDPGLPDPDNPPDTKPKNIPPEPEDATLGSRVMKLTSLGHLRADLIDHVFHFGVAGDMPVTGDWNGDGINAIGIFRNGRWNLDADGDGRWTEADAYVVFGRSGDLPVVGDFNGDGVDDLGVYRAGKWYLDTNGNREIDAHDKVFELGGANDQPVVGDWNGDGTDEVGVYNDAASRVATRPGK